MEAWVWHSDWGLASIDSNCLRMMAYAKFSGAPITFHESGNPFWTPKSTLPVFRQNDLEIASFGLFVSHLRTMNYSADYNLTPKQQSEVIALSQLIEDRLYPALLYVFWLDLNNHNRLTRPWFAQHMSFPMYFYYPKLYRDHAANLIESRLGIKLDENDPGSQSAIELAVFKDAQEGMNMLAERLGNDSYLFGQAPSSADATLYGYLAPLLKAPFPNPTLQNHLLGHENLCKFVRRINSEYFARFLDVKKPTQLPNSSNFEENNADQNSNEEPMNKKNAVIAGAVAFSAMSAYAYHKDLFSIVSNITAELNDNEDSEDEE